MNVLSPEIIVILAGGAQVLGYLVINQIALRLLLLLGTFFYVWYYFVVATPPLWEAIYLSLLMGAANLIGLAGLYLRRSRFSIPGAHRDIYPRFGDLPPGDFRALMKLAHRRVLFQAETITQEGQPVNTLTYVISGTLEIDKDGDHFRMPAGVFVGEVAFMQQKPSAATTTVRAGSEVLEWDTNALRAKAARSDRFRLALESVIYRDLAAKVAHAVAPPGAAWRDQDRPRSLSSAPLSEGSSSIR